MKIHRFIGDFQFSQKEIKILDELVVHQILDVLRLRIGDKIVLGNGKGREALVQIIALGKDSVLVELREKVSGIREPERVVALYVSVLKKDNFELVVQKATEVGIKEIIPVITRRTVKLNIREDRLQKIIKEAAEQSGRITVPVLHPIKNFVDALEHAHKNNEENIFFDIEGEILDHKNFISKNVRKVGIFIGPEGGWDKKELEGAQQNNFRIISLSPLTFRAETAAIIGSYICVTDI